MEKSDIGLVHKFHQEQSHLLGLYTFYFPAFYLF